MKKWNLTYGEKAFISVAVVIVFAALVLVMTGCNTTSQGNMTSEVAPVVNVKGGISPETPILPEVDPDEWLAANPNVRIESREPEPQPEVTVASPTTELIHEVDPAPVLILGRSLAVESVTVSATNNSPLLKSLPHRRLIRPRNMNDKQWSDFLESRIK